MKNEADSRWTLAGKKALVTGATKGIGAAVAAELLLLGAEVCIAARDLEAVRGRVEEWDGGGRLSGVAADVATGEGRERIFHHVEQELGGLDVLVNNVGMNVRKKALDFTGEEYELLMETNVKSVFEMCRLSYEHLKRGEGGSIVNIASVAGIVSVGTGTVYGMTKAAIIQLTRGLAVEWAGDRIRVNAVAPWFTRTPLTRGLLENEEFHRRVVARTPLGRIAEPEDVSGLVAFLCVPAASFITGQCIAPDGGFLAQGL